MWNRRFLLALPASLLLIPSTNAQEVGRDGFRTDVPGVYSPPRPRQPQLTPVQAAYRKAGRPRIVLFMNREISDENRSGVIVRDRAAATSSGSASENSSRRGDETNRETSSSLRAETMDEVVSERIVIRPRVENRQSDVGEAEMWAVEASFHQRMSNDGIRMVDRSTAMRVAGQSGILDRQALETVAIRNLAEAVVVIRHAKMSNGELVWRATVTGTRDGSAVADVMLRESEVDNDRLRVGEELAVRLITSLVRAWNR